MQYRGPENHRNRDEYSFWLHIKIIISRKSYDGKLLAILEVSIVGERIRFRA